MIQNEPYEMNALERMIRNYWLSVPNDSQYPARVPHKIRIVRQSGTIVSYDKLRDSMSEDKEQYIDRVVGIGSIDLQDIEKYGQRKIIAERKHRKLLGVGRHDDIERKG